MGPIPDAALFALNLDHAQGKQAQDIWRRMQDDEALWSSRSQHQIVPDAGHYLQFDRPDAVIAAVRSVVDRVREIRGEH